MHSSQPGAAGWSIRTACASAPDGNLYVSSQDNSAILRYNGRTGAFKGAFVPPGSGGLDFPHGLTFGPDGDLFVSSLFGKSVLRYSGLWGGPIGEFVPAGSGGLSQALGLTFGPDQNLYVCSQDTSTILRYDGRTGAFIDAFVPSGSGGIEFPTYLTFAPAPVTLASVYLSPALVAAPHTSAGTVSLSGAAPSGGARITLSSSRPDVARTPARVTIPAGASSARFTLRPRGVNTSVPVVITASYGGQTASAVLTVRPPSSQTLLVSGFGSNSVERYDAATGAFLDTLVACGSGGLHGAQGMGYGPDGNLYVSSSFTHSVLRYDSSTGAFLGEFVPPGTGGLNFPDDLVFGPDHNLYVSSFSNSEILRFNGRTGAFLGIFVPAGSGGLAHPEGLRFGKDGRLYVTSRDNRAILRFDGQISTYKAWQGAGLSPEGFSTITPVPYGAAYCEQGRVQTVDALVCEYHDQDSLSRGKSAMLDQWGKEGVNTGVAFQTKLTLLGVLDRARRDPNGKVTSQVIDAFRKL